jgi:hypothetical protein
MRSGRSLWQTTSKRSRFEKPIVTNLRSSSECSGSSSVIDIASSKTVTASSKETRCLRTLLFAFASSHSKPFCIVSGDQASGRHCPGACADVGGYRSQLTSIVPARGVPLLKMGGGLCPFPAAPIQDTLAHHMHTNLRPRPSCTPEEPKRPIA